MAWGLVRTRRVAKRVPTAALSRGAVALVIVTVVLALVTAPDAVSPSSVATPFTSLFASLAGSGWLGGDLASSVRLPDGRSAWFAGDTITGASSAALWWVHNSMVITGYGPPQVMLNPLPDRADGSFFWPGAAQARGDQVWALAQRIVPTGSGMWDFRFAGTWLARLTIGSWRLGSVRPVAGGCCAVNWSAGLFDCGRYTYVYGLETRDAHTWLHVARVLKGHLDSRWRFYTGHGWSANPRASARVLSDVSTVSMLDLGHRGLRLISQRAMFGRAVYSWHAQSPAGPFVQRRRIYVTASFGAGTATYNAVAHPQHVYRGMMLFSYNVNRLDVLDPSTAWLYRPRFFWLALGSL